MNIKKILFIFFTLLFLCSCGENKNDEKTDTISTIEETKSQDEVEIDDYVSDEEFDEAILFPKNAKELKKEKKLKYLMNLELMGLSKLIL